jgi:hypothetical protein
VSAKYWQLRALWIVDLIAVNFTAGKHRVFRHPVAEARREQLRALGGTETPRERCGQCRVT